MLPAALDLNGSYVLHYSAFVNVAAKGEFALSNLAGMGDQSSGLANSDAVPVEIFRRFGDADPRTRQSGADENRSG